MLFFGTFCLRINRMIPSGKRNYAAGEIFLNVVSNYYALSQLWDSLHFFFAFFISKQVAKGLTLRMV